MSKGTAGPPRITSADVARASGVSRATVSYVLNNDPHQTIPLETRERVRQAAQRLGYRPFAPARMLRAGQSQVVLAVLPFAQIDPALSRQLKGMEPRLAAHGLTLLCYIGMHPQTGPMHPSAHVTPSVLLSFADRTDPLLTPFLEQFRAPVLHLLGNHQVQEEIGRTQATFLLQGGKRSLLFATSEREDVQELAKYRLGGVRLACAQEGLEAPAVCMLPASRQGARTVLHDCLTRQAAPWGICCYNDEVAFAVLAALADEGIAVPATAAVIGCDNIPLAEFSIPALTTLAVDRESALDPLIEAIVALSQGESISWVPQEVLTLVQRASA
jgi:DNA-binding LacI/PurR family transcriptional regulator